ncbi:MAG: hypothetical protein M1820_005525 [Bogoriella megaspora]|nr:MAG: hypothetical protein M1820_005525 [Bogoriella megaspora]
MSNEGHGAEEILRDLSSAVDSGSKVPDSTVSKEQSVSREQVVRSDSTDPHRLRDNSLQYERSSNKRDTGKNVPSMEERLRSLEDKLSQFDQPLLYHQPEQGITLVDESDNVTVRGTKAFQRPENFSILEVPSDQWRRIKNSDNFSIDNKNALVVSYTLCEPATSESANVNEEGTEAKDVFKCKEDMRIPDRICVWNLDLMDALEVCTGTAFDEQTNVFLRPFKFFLCHENQIKEHLDELERNCRFLQDRGLSFDPESNLIPRDEDRDQILRLKEQLDRLRSLGLTYPRERTDHVSKYHINPGYVGPVPPPLQTRPKVPAGLTPSTIGLMSDADPGKKSGMPIEKQPLITGAEITRIWNHARAMRVLVDYMDSNLKDMQDLRKSIAEGTLTHIMFEDLWHLFKPGDLIFSNQSSDKYPRRAYRVLHVTGGRRVRDDPAALGLPPKPGRRGAPMRSPPMDYDDYDDEEEDGLPRLGVNKRVNPFVVDAFYVDFDGRKFGPRPRKFTIAEYTGSRPIRSLKAYPSKFMNDESSVIENLLDRGQKFVNLTAQSHKLYSGYSIAEGDRWTQVEEINSEVIIDQELAVQSFGKQNARFNDMSIRGPGQRQNDFMIMGKGIIRQPTFADERETYEVVPCNFIGCMSGTDAAEDAAFDIDARKRFTGQTDLLEYCTAKGITDDHLILLPFRVYGYVLQDRKWQALDIDELSDPFLDKNWLQDSSAAFNDLVLPDTHKPLIQALVKNQTRNFKQASRQRTSDTDPSNDSQTSIDLVRGKGRGLVILLHGVPGVGKTSTAECVAAQLRRPLFPITCGDLGTYADEVEERLENYFSLAQKWGCVLLLDEADVFLAKRVTGDLKRNALVSVFLRVLEYYAGVLILTTNRVGEFDEAFRSRIHISLYYPKLDHESTLQIWKMNLRRLEEASAINVDIEKDEILAFAKQHWKETKDRPGRSWNGRQIKNAFQTALALANWHFHDTKHGKKLERPLLKVKHFALVAETSAHFDDYLNETHGADDVQGAYSLMAAREGLRMDTNIGGADADRLSETHGRSIRRASGRSSRAKAAHRQQDEDDSDADASPEIQRLKLELKLAQLKETEKVAAAVDKGKSEARGGSSDEDMF